LNSDQNQIATSTASATAASDGASAETDPSRSWAWHQPAAAGQTDVTAATGSGGGVVVYQLPTATGGNNATASTSDNNQAAITAATQSFYYSIDAYGQLVRHELPPGTTATTTPQATVLPRENQLELEVLHLQNALETKTREVDELRTQLNEAYATVERLKQRENNAAGSGESPNAGEQSCGPSDGNAAAAAAQGGNGSSPSPTS